MIWMPWFFAASALTPSTRRRRLGAFWLPARMRDLALAADLLGELAHHVFAQLPIVDAVVRKPLRLRGVAVERHDRHAARDRVVDRAGHLARVRTRDQDRVGAFVDGLGDPLRLDLSVLLRRRQPDDLDGRADAARQVLRRRLGATARRQEHRVRRALRDHRDADRLAGQRRRAGAAVAARRRRRGQRSAGNPEPARTPPPRPAPTATTTASSRCGLPLPRAGAPRNARSPDPEPPRSRLRNR